MFPVMLALWHTKGQMGQSVLFVGKYHRQCGGNVGEAQRDVRSKRQRFVQFVGGKVVDAGNVHVSAVSRNFGKIVDVCVVETGPNRVDSQY